MIKINFKPFSNRISEFHFKDTILNDDYFICAIKQTTENPKYKSYKVSYSNLIKSYIFFLKNMTNKKNSTEEPFFNPIGVWNFSKKILLNKNIPPLDDILSEETFDLYKNFAVNYTYLKDNLLNKLSELEYKYFGNDPTGKIKQRLPSYIGMVIMNDNLSNENLVKEIYEGEWVQIKGRFLLGTGGIEENNTTLKYGTVYTGDLRVSNNITGGVPSILPSELDLSKHSHRFNQGPKRDFNSDNFRNPPPKTPPSPSFGKFPTYYILSSDIRVNTESSTDVYYPDIKEEFNSTLKLDKYQKLDPDKENEEFNTVSRYGSEHGVLVVGNKGSNKISKKLDIQTYGSDIQTAKFSFRAKIDEISEELFEKNNKGALTEETKNPEPHNNLHQYYATYIWERIK